MNSFAPSPCDHRSLYMPKAAELCLPSQAPSRESKITAVCVAQVVLSLSLTTPVCRCASTLGQVEGHDGWMDDLLRDFSAGCSISRVEDTQRSHTHTQSGSVGSEVSVCFWFVEPVISKFSAGAMNILSGSNGAKLWEPPFTSSA